MTTLHLGVLDMPYARAGSKTTFDVAQILETRYGLMQAFLDMHAPVIAYEVENSLRGAIETVMMGGRGQPFASATEQIEVLFREALSMQSYDFRVPGVPTQAALAGVRHRFKRAYVRRDPRPSFIDTGLYQRSFRAWVDD